METMAFLGCSRGLGREVCLAANELDSMGFSLLMARNEKNLTSLSEKMNHSHEVLSVDFAQASNIPLILDKIKKTKTRRIFYFAGGGPYGLFQSKEWKDHLWGLQVSFLTPSEILHSLLRDPEFSFVEQIVFVGSLIADHKPDPKAASYSSAKHGLKGMIESILEEGCEKDLRFFRPGYMNTDLLPANAKPRVSGELLEAPVVAKKILDWCMDKSGPSVCEEPN